MQLTKNQKVAVAISVTFILIWVAISFFGVGTPSAVSYTPPEENVIDADNPSSTMPDNNNQNGPTENFDATNTPELE